MPGMPELPIRNIPRDQVEVEGVVEVEPIYQTHRGKTPENNHALAPKHIPAPEGLGTYEKDTP